MEVVTLEEWKQPGILTWCNEFAGRKREYMALNQVEKNVTSKTFPYRQFVILYLIVLILWTVHFSRLELRSCEKFKIYKFYATKH